MGRAALSRQHSTCYALARRWAHDEASNAGGKWRVACIYPRLTWEAHLLQLVEFDGSLTVHAIQRPMNTANGMFATRIVASIRIIRTFDN
jgi:hypothetical protein